MTREAIPSTPLPADFRQTQLPTAKIPRRVFDLSRVRGLSARTRDLHLRLYEGYVNASNKLLERVRSQQSGEGGGDEIDATLLRQLNFELNGVTLHENLFEALAGERTGEPQPGSAVSEALDISFGGIDGWQKSIESLAKTRGIGWILCLRDPRTNRLLNTWIDLHHFSVPLNLQLILALDYWEHAYLADSGSDREPWTRCMLENIAWRVLDARCVSA